MGRADYLLTTQHSILDAGDPGCPSFYRLRSRFDYGVIEYAPALSQNPYPFFPVIAAFAETTFFPPNGRVS